MKQICIVIAGCVGAAPAVAGCGAATEGASAIRVAMEQLHEAMVKVDQPRLRALTDEHLTYGHTTGIVEDRNAFVADLVSGRTPYAAITLPQPDIAVSGTTAWVRGAMHAQMRNDHGGTDPVDFKILYVFVRERCEWKLLARQSVK